MQTEATTIELGIAFAVRQLEHMDISVKPV